MAKSSVRSVVSNQRSFFKGLIWLIIISAAILYFVNSRSISISMRTFCSATLKPLPSRNTSVQPTSQPAISKQGFVQSETPKILSPPPCKSITQPPKKVNGIWRSEDEQREEAIEILSLALENAVSKHRRLASMDDECDWTVGKWVKDTAIEYGKGILSGYGKCRVDYRQNCKRNLQSSPYVGYRWVLRNETCEDQRIWFTRERFLETVRNKSIVFIGDSLTRNMFQSLACLLYVANNRTMMIEEHIYRYRYPKFGVTIEFIVSNYLVRQTSANCDSNATVKLARVPCLDLDNVDGTWANRAKEFDIFIFATGGWWEHDLQMRQASDGVKNYRKSRQLMRRALQTVTEYLSRPEFASKELYWRCSEVSHFFGGEWNSGGKCLRVAPSEEPLYNAVSLFIQEAVVDALASSQAKIRLLDITRISSYRQDAHPSSQSRIGGHTDCKHWCLPGVPDHWNEIWLNMLHKSSFRRKKRRT